MGKGSRGTLSFGSGSWPRGIGQSSTMASFSRSKTRRHRLRRVFQNADDAEHRRGINSFAARFVIQRHVAAGNRRAQRGAGFGNAVDGGRKLRHNFGLLRIAEVEAVGGGDGRCAGTRNFARSFRDGMHGAEFGIEIAPAAVTVERHREAALS